MMDRDETIDENNEAERQTLVFQVPMFGRRRCPELTPVMPRERDPSFSTSPALPTNVRLRRNDNNKPDGNDDMMSQSLVYQVPIFGRRRCPELTPVSGVTPRGRELTSSARSKTDRPKSVCIGENMFRSGPKRAVSMSRLSQLAQPRRRYLDEPSKSTNAAAANNAIANSVTELTPVKRREPKMTASTSNVRFKSDRPKSVCNDEIMVQSGPKRSISMSRLSQLAQPRRRNVEENSKLTSPGSSTSPTTPSVRAVPSIQAKIERKRREEEEKRRAEEEDERQRKEEEEQRRKEEEEQRRLEEEANQLAAEHRRMEEEKLRQAILEQQLREEEERRRKEEESRLKAEKEERERKAREEAEKQRLQLEERLRKDEEERLARKKKLEAIMSRTRKTPNNNKSTSPTNNSEEQITPEPPPVEILDLCPINT